MYDFVGKCRDDVGFCGWFEIKSYKNYVRWFINFVCKKLIENKFINNYWYVKSYSIYK